MKKLVFISIIILMALQAYCQEFYFIESFRLSISERSDSLTKYDNGKFIRFSCSGRNDYYITRKEKVVIPNLYEIAIFDLIQDKIDTIIKIPNIPYAETGDRAEYLLSFDMTPNEDIYYELASEIYRLDSNECKLYMMTNRLEKIELPNGINFINFDISPIGNKVAFETEDETTGIKELNILDLKTSQITKVDTSYSFAFDINRKFTFWDKSGLYYLRYGVLWAYDFSENAIHKVDIPVDN